MPCRAALATSAGTIKSIVELLSTASRNGTSGSSDLPSARALPMVLASWSTDSRPRRATPATAVRARVDRPSFPNLSASHEILAAAAAAIVIPNKVSSLELFLQSSRFDQHHEVAHIFQFANFRNGELDFESFLDSKH
jgi:hypothetical protein